MRRRSFCSFLLPDCAWLNSAGDAWRPLFDGATTAGWLEVSGLPFPTACWSIEDGCLHTVPQSEGHCFQDIRTTAEFTAFEFEFEWKIAPGGNSGVKYRIDKVDRWKPARNTGVGAGEFQARGRGPEFQLGGEGSAEDKSCGSLYGVMAASPRPDCRPGEFHRARLLVTPSGRVEHWLDGVRVVAYDRAPRRSPLVLQHHNSAAWFRNLRVRELL